MNFYPELTGIGVYSYGFAEFLAENGYEVEVVTTFPYYPSWKRADGYPRHLYYHERIGTLSVHRCATYVPSIPTPIRRILHESIFAILAFFKMVFVRKPDLLICVSPPFAGMIAAAVVSRLRSIPLHLHIQDLQPDAAIELGMLKGKMLVRILHALERFCYRSASLVSGIGETMLVRMHERVDDSRKLFLFRNWTTLNSVDRPIQHSFRDRHGLKGRFIVLYSGSMGEKQGLETLLECAAIAQSKRGELVFVLVGDGGRRIELEQKTAQLQLQNVLFFDTQLKEDFEDLLRSADVSVLLQRKEVNELVVPSKLINMLAVGSPVVASVDRKSETATILANLSIDVIVESGNPDALYEKICYLRESKDDCARLRSEEPLLADRLFGRENILKEILKRIESVVGNDDK